MRIEKIINDAIMLTEQTSIPVLLLSNPGLGKTTILKNYAKEHGYHLETLIGSRFSPEEISGYQVNNGGDHLTHISPEWFHRILDYKNKGIKTLLFIDELSTCSESVQGALLSLIFDRTIGSEKFLPEDCVIISAANYSENLPVCMNIMSPTLNRFILINLNEDYTGMDLLDEFIADDDSEKNSKPYKIPNLPKNFESFFNKEFKSMWKEIFLKYSDMESSIGYLDISNKNLEGIYASGDSFVYNFISGRTISYLQRTLLAYIQLGISNKYLLKKIIDGLVGKGTNNFKDKKQQLSYRKYVYKLTKFLIDKNPEEEAQIIPLQHDIIKDIQAFTINTENLGFYHNQNISQVIEIIDEIKSNFVPAKIFEKLSTNEGAVNFTAQMEAMFEFHKMITQYPDSSNLTFSLTKTLMDFYGLYCEILNISPAYNSIFGCTNNMFEKIMFLTKTEKDGTTTYYRAGLRKNLPGELKKFYRAEKDECFVDLKLKYPVQNTDGYKVIFWDGKLKSMASSEYVSTYGKLNSQLSAKKIS